MASFRSVEPVLHCRKDRPREVVRLSVRLLTGVFAHTTEFPNPVVDKVFFESKSKELSKLIASAKGNTNKKNLRDVLARELHGYCSEMLEYVKPICKGNVKLITLTGFEVNRQPRKHQAPAKRVILKIVRHGGATQYKMILAKMQVGAGVTPDPATHQRDVRYTVELTITPEDPKSWNKVCVSAPSTKLIFDEVFPGMKNYVRVYGTNAAGNGPRSNETYFTPVIP